MSDHPYLRLWDAIASFSYLSTQERAVLWSLARHADWDDGANAWPSQATIAREVGLSERQVRRLLSSLSCSATLSCPGAAGCQHRGLIETGEQRPGHRKAYRLTLTERSIQPHLPEVGNRPLMSGLNRTSEAVKPDTLSRETGHGGKRTSYRPTEPQTRDPFEKVIRRSWPA